MSSQPDTSVRDRPIRPKHHQRRAAGRQPSEQKQAKRIPASAVAHAPSRTFGLQNRPTRPKSRPGKHLFHQSFRKVANPIHRGRLIRKGEGAGKEAAKAEKPANSTGRIRDRTPPWLRTSELESQNTLDSLHHRRYFSDPTSTFLCSSAGRAGGC